MIGLGDSGEFCKLSLCSELICSLLENPPERNPIASFVSLGGEHWTSLVQLDTSHRDNWGSADRNQLIWPEIWNNWGASGWTGVLKIQWSHSSSFSQSKLEWFSREKTTNKKRMDQSLLRWRNIISLHEGAEMMVISPAGNSPGFHITMTSRKRDASGKANSESDVSSNQRRQLRGSFVRGWWSSSWEAPPVHRAGSTSGLPDLSELPGWVQGPHITPWVFCLYLHFAFHWTEEMWLHES